MLSRKAVREMLMNAMDQADPSTIAPMVLPDTTKLMIEDLIMVSYSDGYEEGYEKGLRFGCELVANMTRTIGEESKLREELSRMKQRLHQNGIQDW